jgi:hypothetical protein
MLICSFAFGELTLFGSFACPKETNQRKRQPQIFFGLNILSVARALQLPFGSAQGQTVMLTLPSLQSGSFAKFAQRANS